MPVAVGAVRVIFVCLFFVDARSARLETDRVREALILAYHQATYVRILRDPGAVLGREVFLVPVAVGAVQVAFVCLFFVDARSARLETDRVREVPIFVCLQATYVRIDCDPGAVLGGGSGHVPFTVGAGLDAAVDTAARGRVEAVAGEDRVDVPNVGAVESVSRLDFDDARFGGAHVPVEARVVVRRRVDAGRDEGSPLRFEDPGARAAAREFKVPAIRASNVFVEERDLVDAGRVVGDELSADDVLVAGRVVGDADGPRGPRECVGPRALVGAVEAVLAQVLARLDLARHARSVARHVPRVRPFWDPLREPCLALGPERPRVVIRAIITVSEAVLVVWQRKAAVVPERIDNQLVVAAREALRIDLRPKVPARVNVLEPDPRRQEQTVVTVRSERLEARDPLERAAHRRRWHVAERRIVRYSRIQRLLLVVLAARVRRRTNRHRRPMRRGRRRRRHRAIDGAPNALPLGTTLGLVREGVLVGTAKMAPLIASVVVPGKIEATIRLQARGSARRSRVQGIHEAKVKAPAPSRHPRAPTGVVAPHVAEGPQDRHQTSEHPLLCLRKLPLALNPLCVPFRNPRMKLSRYNCMQLDIARYKKF